jgi:hypothetical protein
MTPQITALLARYEEWAADRTRVSAAEETGTADPDDWAASDDAAVELLRDIAAHLWQVTR